MRKNPRTKLLFIWIACFAMLLNALAPSISHAVTAWGSAPSSPMMEICTMNGVQSIASMTAISGPLTGDPSGPSHTGGNQHCPFCLPHGGSIGLLPPDLPVLPIMAGHDVFPHLFYHAPHRLFSWTAANPRGPPLAS
ncbi:MAG: DUF2946 domain-containing protein [Glaciimonas sp.]|nr:DUF2946 domain-containing protein [Glaciimonas sp.]